MRTVVAVSVMCLVMGVCFMSVSAAESADGNVVLVLDNALPTDGGWVELELEFPVRGGEWAEVGWGYAVRFQRGHHVPRIVSNVKSEKGRAIRVEVLVEPDNWTPGGKAEYDIELRHKGSDFEGSFGGHFRRGTNKLGGPDKALPLCLQVAAKSQARSWDEIVGSLGDVMKTQGKVSGRMQASWPGVVPGYVPPEPGEHPRLAFRKSELPILRQRALETPEGKAILERAKAVVDQCPSDGDKFSTWPAVGYGFLYAMTGEEAYADRARSIVTKTIFANVSGRQGEQVVQDIHHAPRLQGLALAYDLCHDSWDEAFRLKCVDEIQCRTWELRIGEFEGAGMAGYNPNPWSNHNAIRVSCAGLGALAVMGEKNSLGRVMADAGEIADLMAWEARQHFLTGLGGSGYCIEGSFYKNMTHERGFAYFPPAYAKARGLSLDSGTIGDFDLIGYFLEADPGSVTPRAPSVALSVAMGSVPEDMMPGVKWIFDRVVGLKGDKSFGIDYGMMAPFAMALYPFDVAEREPGECFRWMAPDPLKGHWVFRPQFRDRDDILLTLNMKSETLFGSWAPARAGTQCDFVLKGFGKTWIDGTFLVRLHRLSAFNLHHGGRLTSWRETADRTAVMNWNMDLAYLQEVPGGRKGEMTPEDFCRRQGGTGLRDVPNGGGPYVDFGIRATRSMAVDCSGLCGSPLLVAVVDQVTVPTNLTTAGAGGKAAAGRDMEEAAQQEALRALLKQAGVAVAGKSATSSEPPADAYTRWELPVKSGLRTVEGNGFVVGAGEGPTLSGVLAGPARLASDSILSDAKGTYFTVFTLQKGPAQLFDVRGEGLDAVVKVGKRVVKFEGGSLVLE